VEGRPQGGLRRFWAASGGREGQPVPGVWGLSLIVTAMLGRPPDEAEKAAAERLDAELREQVADALEVEDAGKLELRNVRTVCSLATVEGYCKTFGFL
jgi:hypothetical protein